MVVNTPGPNNANNSVIELAGYRAGSSLVEVTDWIVDGFEVTGGSYAGFHVWVSQRITVSNNYVHDNDTTGIFLGSAYYPVIQYNECSYNGSSHGIYFSNSGDYATVVGNPSYKADATITVHDQDCQPLVGVTVDITWTGAAAGTDSDVTDENGQVTFTSDRNKAGGTFTCCVDDLTKTGYPYSSGDNHETCDSIVNP